MDQPLILEDGRLVEMMAAIQSFAVSLKKKYEQNQLTDIDELINNLRRQNYYFYKKARREKDELLRQFHKSLSLEIAAQIKSIRKYKNIPQKCKPSLGIIIDKTSTKTRRELFQAATIATVKVGLLSKLLGRTTTAEAASVSRIKEYLGSINNRRPLRPHSKYIILHMTEGYDNGLEMIKRQGTAHYVIAINGTIYQTMKDGFVAKHAGRSWWDGKKELNNYALGIEIVGFWKKGMTVKQYDSLKWLLTILQKKYGINDNRVIPHAMVSYFIFKGIPHRPRRTCGTLFAQDAVRTRLGLASKPTYDPEIKSGRIRIGNKQAYEALWGKGSTSSSRDELPIVEEEVEFQTIGKDGNTAYSIAGTNWNKKNIIYILPTGVVLTGKQLTDKKSQEIYYFNPNSLPRGTRILVNYIYGGKIKLARTAYSIAGKLWNHPSTLYYQVNDKKIITGDEIDSGSIQQETIVFFRD